mgnify:CR=1 FL=1
MLLAFILCFSTLPMTAFAQEADAVTEQEEQQEAAPAAEPEEQQEADSAEEQKEAEAVAAPGEETSSDKSTTAATPGTEDPTAGEAPDTVKSTGESISDNDAGTQDTAADDEKKAAVQKVQALIDALPETVTEDNAESVGEQLEAIDEAMESLTEEQIAELDMTRLNAISEAMNAPMTVAEGETHIHYLCGGDECNKVGHTETDKVTFKAWKETSALPTVVGNYYLMNDVTLSESWRFVNGVVLCLNGHTITVEAKDSGITVGNGKTFTLCNCTGSGKITHGTDSNGDKYDGRGVDVSKGTFNMYGGSITGNKELKGAGVDMYCGTFNMYGGSITGNEAKNLTTNSDNVGIGGGVYMEQNSTFNMYDGTISNNTGEYGGGVNINSKSVFNMSGGTIENNKATGNNMAFGGGGGVNIAGSTDDTFNMSGGTIRGNTTNTYGGGVYVSWNFNMTGGEITGNRAAKYGGGVYVKSAYGNMGHFTVSGSAKVSDNTTSNVYLPDGATMAIGQGGFDKTASIGVTTKNLPTLGSYVAIATGAADDYKDGTFTADQTTGDCEFQQVGDQILLVNGTLHQHPICGNTCDHDSEHANVAWKGVSLLSEITTGGYYYLTQNIEQTQTWNLPNDRVVLCLNGYNITANANVDVIKISSYAQFILTDCMGGKMEYGKITHKEGSEGRGIYVNGIFTMYGGEISGNTADAPSASNKRYGGGVYVYDGCSFTMNGGKITSNTAGFYGGGVYLSRKSNFTMNGGSITGNSAQMSGGGVELNGGNSGDDSTFTVSGKAVIKDNLTKGSSTKANNVACNGTIINVASPGLDSEAHIGVSTNEISEGDYKVVAQGKSSYQMKDTDAERFHSDNGYASKLIGNSIVFMNGTLHEHAFCGKTGCTEEDHDNTLWIPLTYDSENQILQYGRKGVKKSTYNKYTLPAGNYYLFADITLNGSIEISGDVNICLNGHTISTKLYNSVFDINSHKLAVCDCSTGHSGKIEIIDNHSETNPSFVVRLNAAQLCLYGGTIQGGDYGVYSNNSSVELFGGSITGNTIGVDGSSYYSLAIGGDAKVINNTTKNLVLLGKSVISIDKSLTSNAQIGISTFTKPSANANIKIATGATNSELDYAQIFTPDTSDQKYVVTKDEKGNLYMGLHQHSWTYTTGGDDTIKVTCSADGCNLESDFAATYKVTAPTVLTYSGSDKVATVKVSDNATGEEFPDVPKIVYQKQTGGSFEEMEGVPKDAGTYRAEIRMGNQSAWVIYAIKEKTVTTPTIEVMTPVTYNGTAQKPTVVVKDGANVILASEYSVSYADNINAGTATVTITDVAGGNYNVSGSTTFTINKGAYNGTVEKKVTIIKKRSTAQTGTLTAADFFPEEAVPEGAVISNVNGSFDSDVMNPLTLDQDAGKISYITAANITSTTDQTCKVIISSTNYENIEATLTFHPTDKMTVTIDGLTYTNKTYDGGVIQPTGTLLVTGGNVPANELEVLYEGTGNTTYNGPTAPKDAGTYKVTYKVADSNENYTGEVTYYFTISPKAVTADMIGAIADETYTGNDITPQPVVTDGNTILTSGADFDFIYDKNINAGKDTATLTITGKGNYTGTASRTFTISPKDIKGAAIKLQADSLEYTGLMQEVQITFVTLNQVPLTANDYDIVNNSNKQINVDDSITLTIAGKGNYTGTATTTWKITRATPALDNFDVTPDLSQKQTYDGKPKEVTAKTKNGVIDMGDVTVCYEGISGTTYTKSETAPANAGTYQVILSVVEGKNYTKAEITAGTLTIGKADLTVGDVTEFFEYTKTGAQTISLAELVPGATNYAPGTYTDDNGILTGDLTIDATGLMKFTLSALTIANIDNKVTVPVTITSENYKNVTVNVTIYISPEYRIIDGAGSSWTQNTTGTVVIRGNGEYNRFRAVKVDGKVIDPANYDKKEGSTIITLKAEYLKTLATGSHTFAIVWNNGIAGTNFTVAANTSGNNSGNNNNNDSNHGSDNSGNNDSGNTAGAAANTAGNQQSQELDKVPATGDPFGIWLTLFAISLTGLAGMLARRKKN